MSKRCQIRESIGIVKVVGYTGRLLLAVIIGLASVNLSPATARAEPNPVDLELGGAGATSWNITDIKPTDNGTKAVTLHNAGSKDGFVTIWLSDIVSSEGVNPESETGDIAEPGELADHLLFALSGNGLDSSLSLPTVVSNFPRSTSDPGYIEVIPLKVGNTVDLQWQWELPAQTGNDAQGDGLSFTINYLLREIEIIDLSAVVTAEGVFTETVIVVSGDGSGQLTIAAGTVGQTGEGAPLTEIWLIDIDKEPSAPSEDTTTIGFQYSLGPEGATFDPPITITLTYDPNDMPARAKGRDLVITMWDKDTAQWVALEGYTVDTVNHTISAPISHFSRYTVVSPVPPRPFFWGPSILPTPLPAIGPREEVTVRTVLESNMAGSERKVEIGADGTLREPLTLSDLNGNFVLELDSGSKITGSDGIPVTRIELTVTEEPLSVPDDTVILSPIYELTGYINEAEVPLVNFNPPARLTILYDPRYLPENTFPPFIAYYSVAQRLVPIEPPPGSTVEIGKAKAQIRHASLFVVAAELVPPPPPLPPKFQVSSLIVNPRQGRVGRPVVISLEIANDGESAGNYELQLKIDGIVRLVREVTLAAKSSETVIFEITNLSVGRHQVEVAGLSEQFRIVSTAVLPAQLAVDWLTLDLAIFAGVVTALLTLYLVRRRL